MQSEGLACARGGEVLRATHLDLEQQPQQPAKHRVHHRLRHEGDDVAAEAAYKKGVKAAIEQWGIDMPADYFDNPAAAYDGTLERIILQKYYALYFVDYQQWFDYRRTGFPVLPKEAGMENNQQMPVRFYYPIEVRNNNPENYQEAVGWLGADDFNTKVWWEK